MKVRLLPLFVWLEWRQTLNSLRGARRRDSVERLSRWTRVVLPLAAIVLLIPTAFFLAAMAAAGAWAVTSDPDLIPVARILAGFAVVALLFIILLGVVTSGRGTPGRNQLMRLLPINRAWLSVSEVIRPLASPLVLLGVAAFTGVPVGLALAGKPVPALSAAVGGLLMLAFTIALAGVVSLSVQLVLRKRNRAELAALIGVVLMSLLAVVPSLVTSNRNETGSARGGSAPRQEHTAPAWTNLPEITPWALALPPVAYAESWTGALEGRWRIAAGGLLALAGWAGLCLLAVPALHRRMAETPELNTLRRSGTVRGLLTADLPADLTAVAAVAALTSRVLLRTVRGRVALFSPSLMAVLISLVFAGARYSPFSAVPHLALAVFVYFVSVSGFSTLTCNQLALFGQGLSGLALRPISEVRILRGIALAFTALLAAAMIPAAAFLTWHLDAVSPSLAISLWLIALATHLLLSPAAAILSAVFPQAVDLTSATKGGQAHGLAQLFHFIAVLPAAAAGAGVLLAAHIWVSLPAAAPLSAGLWLLLTGPMALLALAVSARVVRARRENLLLAAVGR